MYGISMSPCSIFLLYFWQICSRGGYDRSNRIRAAHKIMLRTLRSFPLAGLQSYSKDMIALLCVRLSISFLDLSHHVVGRTSDGCLHNMLNAS
jgi:hypothetical protein